MIEQLAGLISDYFEANKHLPEKALKDVSGLMVLVNGNKYKEKFELPDSEKLLKDIKSVLNFETTLVLFYLEDKFCDKLVEVQKNEKK